MSVDILAINFTSTTTATDTISVEIIGALKGMGRGSGRWCRARVTWYHARLLAWEGSGVRGWSWLVFWEIGATCRARLYVFLKLGLMLKSFYSSLLSLGSRHVFRTLRGAIATDFRKKICSAGLRIEAEAVGPSCTSGRARIPDFC